MFEYLGNRTVELAISKYRIVCIETLEINKLKYIFLWQVRYGLYQLEVRYKIIYNEYGWPGWDMYNCTNKWRITRKTNFSGESLARRIRDQLIHIFCQPTHTGMRLEWGGRLTKFMLLICFLVSMTRQRLSQSLEASAFVLSHRQGNLPKLGQLGLA